MPPTLFACGSNSGGQLALGHTDDVSTFTRCQFDPSCGTVTAINDLVSAASHCLLLATAMKDGEEVQVLLGAGTNNHGQMGLQCALTDGCQRSETTFRPLGLRREAGLSDDWVPIRIAATWMTSFVVYAHTETGEQRVISCGSNDFGELGVPPGPSAGPVVVDLGLKRGEVVELLRGGQRHIVSVLSGGQRQRVVGWGAARRGELSATSPRSAPTSAKGRGKAPARPATLSPTQIDLAIPPGTRIVDVRLGAAHSLALISNGDVLAWGNDLKGQITGLANAGASAGVRQLGATWGGSYLLTSEGVWSQGSNTHGQLLRPTGMESAAATNPCLPSAALVPLPSNVEATSLCTGSEHVLVTVRNCTASLSEDKDDMVLYTGGWNEHGNLALGDADDRPSLTPVRTLPKGEIIGVRAGCAASWVWLDLELQG